jgi:hypothetical protein
MHDVIPTMDGHYCLDRASVAEQQRRRLHNPTHFRCYHLSVKRHRMRWRRADIRDSGEDETGFSHREVTKRILAVPRRGGTRRSVGTRCARSGAS